MRLPVEPGNSVIIYQFLMGFIPALLISAFSVKIKFLTVSGGIAALLQSRYKCSECSRIVDRKIHCGSTTVRHRGISFINNDFVNLAAGIFGGIIVFF